MVGGGDTKLTDVMVVAFWKGKYVDWYFLG